MYLQRLILRIAWYPTETFQSSYYMYLYPDFEIQMTLYLFKLVIILFLHLLMINVNIPLGQMNVRTAVNETSLMKPG